MTETHAVRRTVSRSPEIEEQIESLLAVGWVRTRASRCLSWPGWARLIIQRAVEQEFDAWLGRARYERRPGSERGVRDDGVGAA